MEVEVVFPQICGAFYKATIVDLQVEEQKALLSFEDNWKPDSWAELDHVRFLPDPPTSSFIQPGSKVEALLPHQDNEPPGWWNGTLLKSKGELHVVEFQSGNEKYQDIVDQDKIRPPNNKEPLSKCQFVSQEFSVSEDLQSFCDKPAIHENFRKRIGAVCVQYSMDKESLVVQASSEESMHKASLLIDMHLRDLRTQKQLMDRAGAVAQREHQQHRRKLESGVYEQQIHVVSDLVGLAIGRDGHNVNEVRKLDGILSVEFEDYNQMFRVRAKTPEVLTKAKELLEIIRNTVMIPRNLAGRVIGKRGHVIQEILEKSGVHNIRVLGDDESSSKDSASSSASSASSSSEVPFDFIGRKAAVDNAVLMLEYHLDHLKNLETLLQSREFDGQSTDEPPTYYPAPHRPFRRGGRRGGEERGRGGESWGGRGVEERERGGENWGGRGGEERGRGGEERGRRGEQWGGRGNWGGRGGWGEKEGGGRGGGRWRERERDFGRKRGEEERHTTESGYADHTDSSAPTPDTVAAGNDDEIYQSSDESNSVEEKEEEEEEEEVEQRNGQDHSNDEKSPPETEEQGPDRRRQQGPPRQQQRGWGGGGGGGGRGRGRGGYSRGRWRGRGGRGRGGGGGYRNSRPQQSQDREEGVAAASTDWGSEETTRTDGDTTATGRGPAPKPQRSERGRGRNRNPATSNNSTANSASTGDNHTPGAVEP